MLSRGGDDGAHSGEDFCAGRGAEATGDLHPQLHHADVLLCLVVGEGHIEILGEAQHVGFTVTQAAQQIVPRPPRRSAARAGAAGERRLALMQGEPHSQGGIIGRCDASLVGLGQRHGAARPGLTNQLVGRAQHGVHHPGPRLALDLDERLQFAQMVSVAQGMQGAAQGIVRLEMIVDDDALGHGSEHIAAFFAVR